MSRVIQTELGSTLRLTKKIGEGGEGVVWTVEGKSDLLVKLYHPKKAAERATKIRAMVAAGLHSSIDEAAFPIDVALDGAGTFVGFTMKKAGLRRPIHEAYSPTSRKVHFPRASFPFLLRVACNVANAVAKIHSIGCVIGDINHSGVLVSDDATVTLIDTDSFQVRHGANVYPCHVGVPEFTPPELQGKPFAASGRTENHDGFGLSVLIFYILFMGRHPFAGRPLGSADVPELSEAIAQFRFAYSARKAQTRLEPPPNVPTLTDLPLTLASMFENAFGNAGVSHGRPNAAEWVSALQTAEREVVKCASSSSHHYFRSASSCPWCRMEKAIPGFHVFPARAASTPASAALDVGQLIAALRSVPDPGPAPSLETLMPRSATLSPSPKVETARDARRKGAAGVAVGLTFGALLLFSPASFAFGILAVAASAAFAFVSPATVSHIRGQKAQAQQKWSTLTSQWSETAGNERFQARKADGEAAIEAIKELRLEENRRLGDLEAKRREGQMTRHLEDHLIADAKIKGLGIKRKIRLQSFNIESAADVNPHAIRRVPGCAALTDSLMAWRRTIERLFVFDPSIPVDPVQLAAVKSDVANRRVALEARVRQSIAQLNLAASEVSNLRANPGQPILSAWSELRQSEIDSEALDASKGDPTQAIRLVSVALLLGSLAIGGNKIPHNVGDGAGVSYQTTASVPARPSPMVEPSPWSTTNQSPPMNRPASWTQRPLSPTQTAFVLQDPNVGWLTELTLRCEPPSRYFVEASPSSDPKLNPLLVKLDEGDVGIFTLSAGRASGSAAAAIWLHVVQVARSGVDRTMLLGAGLNSGWQTIRVPASADIARAYDACRNPRLTTGGQGASNAPYPAPANIPGAASQTAGQSPNRPTDAGALRPQPQPTPRPIPSRTREVGTGTGGLY